VLTALARQGLRGAKCVQGGHAELMAQRGQGPADQCEVFHMDCSCAVVRLAVAARGRPPLSRYRSMSRSGGPGRRRSIESCRERGERLPVKIGRCRCRSRRFTCMPRQSVVRAEERGVVMAVALGPRRKRKVFSTAYPQPPSYPPRSMRVSEGCFATRMTGSSQHLRKNDPLSAVPSRSAECMTPVRSMTSTPPQFELRCGGLHLVIRRIPTWLVTTVTTATGAGAAWWTSR